MDRYFVHRHLRTDFTKAECISQTIFVAFVAAISVFAYIQDLFSRSKVPPPHELWSMLIYTIHWQRRVIPSHQIVDLVLIKDHRFSPSDSP